MENRNVIIVVILSTAILIGWSMYFENPNEVQKKKLEIQGKTETQTPTVTARILTIMLAEEY